ncbi:MAG: hypothetical protein ACFFCZ_06570 [Promethearchaeota archaeon]
MKMISSQSELTEASETSNLFELIINAEHFIQQIDFLANGFDPLVSHSLPVLTVLLNRLEIFSKSLN